MRQALSSCFDPPSPAFGSFSLGPSERGYDGGDAALVGGSEAVGFEIESLSGNLRDRGLCHRQ